MPPVRRPKTRRGPKPKTIGQRKLSERILKPVIYPERTYTQWQRIRVLVFLEHYRIPCAQGNKSRNPSQQEAAEIYGVPQRTISDWVRKKKQIEGVGENALVRTEALEGISHCWWPELEAKLYEDFIKWREQGRIVRRGWFQVQAGFWFRELYLTVSSSIFHFSNGWFWGFLGRYRISLRSVTKKAQKVPEEYQSLVINWLRFNRRNAQPTSDIFFDIVLRHPVGRFDLSNICNLDETPIPYEYLEGKTYDMMGATTVWAKSSQSGWDKRQSSLVLCVFADRVARVPPMIIFRGKGKRLGKEKQEYHSGVLVGFNDKAYMNDKLFLSNIHNHLVPVLGGRPTLFAIDLMGSHKTPAVLAKLRSHNITPSLIPGGCTSLVQPLDVAINKPFKDLMREHTDEAIFSAETIETFHKWTVSQRCILTTQCVGDVFYKFHAEKAEIIRRVFRKVGLSLPIDGRADKELDIKGFLGLQIGDWRNDVGVAPAEAEILDTNDENEDIEFVVDSS